MLNLDTSRNVTQTEHMEHESKINDIHSDMSHLSNRFNDYDKWNGAKGSATKPKDIEFLEYHYDRLIRKYDVPFEKLEDVKSTCLHYLDKKKAKEELERLAQSLKIYETEVQRRSDSIRNYEEWLAEGGEER